MTRVGEAIDAAKHRRDRTEAGAAGDQKHHQDLVFDGLDGRDPG